MKDVIDKIKKKIESCEMGGDADWNKGYITGLEEAIEALYEKLYDCMVPWNDYFVIMFKDGDPYHPYVQEMRLYQITGNVNRSFYFTANVNAINRFDVQNADAVILKGVKDIRQRVFFTKQDAEKALEDFLI
jgi:hypothetical protein